MKGILILGIFLFLSCVNSANWSAKLDPIETDINHTVFYAKKEKENIYSWNKVNEVSGLKYLFDKKGEGGSPRIIFDRETKIDTFSLVKFAPGEMEPTNKSYKGFEFVGTFETRNSPFDYYFDFYINPSNKDILEIILRTQGKKLKEDTGILFMHDSTNYMRDLAIF